MDNVHLRLVVIVHCLKITISRKVRWIPVDQDLISDYKSQNNYLTQGEMDLKGQLSAQKAIKSQNNYLTRGEMDLLI